MDKTVNSLDTTRNRRPACTDLHDGGILLGTLLELFIVQLGVLVHVHLSEQLVDSL